GEAGAVRTKGPGRELRARRLRACLASDCVRVGLCCATRGSSRQCALADVLGRQLDQGCSTPKRSFAGSASLALEHSLASSHAGARRLRRRLSAASSRLLTTSANATPKLSFDRQATRQRWARLWGEIRRMNSSGMAVGSTPVILAPPFEKLLTMHSRAKDPSQSYIVADEFHSTRKLLRRS